MKFRLKDQELQKKLDEISGGDFTKKLEEQSDKMAEEFKRYTYVFAFRIQFGEKCIVSERFSFLVRCTEVERINEYDPNSWNKWSEVTPPEGIPLRVKIFHAKDKELKNPIYRLCGFYHKDTDEIIYPSANMYENDQIGEILFMPWED